MDNLILLVIALGAGIFSGMFGIGGGLVIVPALIFLTKLGDREAIATSLAALVPPVGLLGALEYYRGGYVNVRYAALIAAGLFVGAVFGAKIMIGLPVAYIRKLYAIFLLAIAARMLFWGK